MDDGFLPWHSILYFNVLNILYPTIKFIVEPAKCYKMSKTLIINFLDYIISLNENGCKETKQRNFSQK